MELDKGIDYPEVNSFIVSIIQSDTLEECFSGFINPTPKINIISKKSFEERIVKIFRNIPIDLIENATKFFIIKISFVTNHKTSIFLFSFLKNIIENEFIKPIIVCRFVLSENFKLSNEIYWVEGLNFIQSIIHLVKYKEVRDILTILLQEILPLVPIKSSNCISNPVNSYFKLISYILDRNAALLPAYLVLDEIQNKFFLYQQCGHWKLSKLMSLFVESFRPLAKIVSHFNRPVIMPIVGYYFSMNSVKLDEKAKYKTKGSLPYDKEVNEPQYELLLHIIEQHNSRETIANILSLKPKESEEKNPINILEKIVIELIATTVNKSCLHKKFFENDNFDFLDFIDPEDEMNQIVLMWNHVSTTYLYFEFLYQAFNFTYFINGLYERLFSCGTNTSKKSLLKCREFLMWTLLQVLSVNTNSFADIGICVQNFFNSLYQDKEPLNLPDFSKQNSVYIMAAASIWILLDNHENSFTKTKRVPLAIKKHVEFLKDMMLSKNFNSSNQFLIAILLNSYATNTEGFTKIYSYFIENILSGNSVHSIKCPLSMALLDSLTIHTRKHLTKYITTRLLNLIQTKSTPGFPSALVESYCRLISYSEIELTETKNLNHLLATILRTNCWNYLYNLLELYSYRLHRINCANQIQLLRQLFGKSHLLKINHIQLYSFMENTTLRILYGFNCFELISFCSVHPKLVAEIYNFLPPDSEELYKIFVYSLARAIHVTGTETLSSDKYISWVHEILTEIKNLNTNLTWPSFTLQCFPSIIKEFYQSNSKKEQNHSQLKRSVDEEYRRWKSISNENDLIIHFTTQGSPPLIYCLLYRMLLDNEPIPQLSYKILDRIGVRALSVHLRTFADFLVLEFANLMGGNHVNISIEAVNDLIWKYHVVTLDKLLLCLALRSFEGREAQVCFFIIQLLVLKNLEFKTRVIDFIKENPVEHWRQSNWYEVQCFFQQKYPEKYYFDHLQEINNQCSIPSIFNNLCLRILPVFDIILHRLIELLSGKNVSTFNVDTILDEYGCLYKFHSHPITFLYNTLHYYEVNLREKPSYKKKLVYTIINAFKDVKPRNWAITETFLNYCQKNNEEEWSAGSDYYKFLISRFVDTLSFSSSRRKCQFSNFDDRFNEFPNVQSHALYVTCVEILALPVKPLDVTNSLLNVVLSNHKTIPRSDIELWINATGTIMTALPESYSCVLKEKFIDLLKNFNSYSQTNFSHLFDFKNCYTHICETETSYILALSHSYWNHSTLGQLCLMPEFIKTKVKPIVRTEEQLMLVCYFVGPFLHRFASERTRCLIDIAHELYQMLDTVDKNCTILNHIDTICDLFYHLKYRFTGNLLKKHIDERIESMRPELQQKLRFHCQVSDESVN